ncbi:nuclease-related domain-containing protein [Actinocorallia longicatena]|uniref:NERD domain-containing protein n=1 Tax=Actinocorallia longicatena TaxID=111803 RepID=A0ABP6QI39_9ACTN
MALIERGEVGSARGQPPGKPGGDGETSTYGDVLGNPQLQRWALRIGVATVIGVLFAIVFDLRVGVTVAIIAVIADTVRKARSVPSDQAHRRASAAERKTARQLRGLTKQGWHILHARAVPRDSEGVSDGKIDHLVIGPTGVYAIDSEQWDKRLPVRTLSHLKLFHGPFEKKDRLDEARWEANQASRLLSKAIGVEIPVQPSVAIYGPAIPWRIMTVRNVDVYAGGTARKYLRKKPKVLTAEEVERIAEVARTALPSKFPE